MKRKTLIISIIAIIISLFSISYTFAANTMGDMRNGIRNAVGSAENMVEGAGSAIGKTIQNGTNSIGNGVKNAGNTTANVVGSTANNRDNDGYTATRTTGINNANTTTGNVSTSTYTWIIIAVTAIAIGVLLWSYFAYNKKNDMYIDSNNK